MIVNSLRYGHYWTSTIYEIYNSLYIPLFIILFIIVLLIVRKNKGNIKKLITNIICFPLYAFSTLVIGGVIRNLTPHVIERDSWDYHISVYPEDLVGGIIFLSIIYLIWLLYPIIEYKKDKKFIIKAILIAIILVIVITIIVILINNNTMYIKT